MLEHTAKTHWGRNVVVQFEDQGGDDVNGYTSLFTIDGITYLNNTPKCPDLEASRLKNDFKAMHAAGIDLRTLCFTEMGWYWVDTEEKLRDILAFQLPPKRTAIDARRMHQKWLLKRTIKRNRKA